MAAAIAYNAFFALVPLAIALVAGMSLIGRSEAMLSGLAEALDSVLPPNVAGFVTDLIRDTAQSLDGSQWWIIVGALAIALYSGSRGVTATMKALRLVQGSDDGRGFLRIRALGVGFTLAAGIALVAAQIFILVGSELLATLEHWSGLSWLSDLATTLAIPILGLWTVALLSALYRWGPPAPLARPVACAVAAAALIGIGSWLFGLLVPRLGLSTIGVLGSFGVVLLWIYFMALIVIAVPEVAAAIVDEARRRVTAGR